MSHVYHADLVSYTQLHVSAISGTGELLYRSQNLSAGCFAAITGFMLNFTVHENAAAATRQTPHRQPSTTAPLSPDQHRLTDDGDVEEDAAQQAQQEARSKQNDNSLENASTKYQKASQAQQRIQAELADADQAATSRSKSPALHNVFSQIRVCEAASAVVAVLTWVMFLLFLAHTVKLRCQIK